MMASSLYFWILAEMDIKNLHDVKIEQRAVMLQDYLHNTDTTYDACEKQIIKKRLL